MRFAAGYDEPFTRQFFLRTFRSLAPFSNERILPEEMDYVAGRFASTATFNLDARIGSPWFAGTLDDAADLARATRRTGSRPLLLKAETAANHLLVVEGVVTRGGLDHHIRESFAEANTRSRRRKRIASALFRNASHMERLRESERFILGRMAFNIEAWVRLLSLLPGNDYFEALALCPSTTLILPGTP